MGTNTQKRQIALALAIALLPALLLSGISIASPDVEASTRLVDLKVNYRENPLGIEIDNIRFSWKMASNVIGQGQKSYQIAINEGSPGGAAVWNSGNVASGLSVAIPFSGDTSIFKLETRYYWTVTVVDVFGGVHAETAFFETGADWGGVDWITKDGFVGAASNTHVYSGANMNVLMFRTEEGLASNAPVASARLYITGLGNYVAYINGQIVEGEKSALLNPGWTDYTTYVNYQTYDVKDYISGGGGDGGVALAAYVGSGFYAGRNGGAQTGTFRDAANEATNATERCLLAKLVIEYADGETQRIITTPGAGWQVSGRTPVLSDGVGRNGEVFDGRIAKQFEGWNDVGFDYAGTAADWSGSAKMVYTGTGHLGKNLIGNDYGVAYEFERLQWVDAYQYKDWVTAGSYPDFYIVDPGDIKPGALYFGGDSEYRTGEIDPAKMTKYGPGETITVKDGNTLVLDFGQNASGVPNMVVSSDTPGVILDMLNGENVSDGNSQRGSIQNFNPNTMPWPKGVVNYESGAGNGKRFQYILAGEGEKEHYQAEFHFVGYRYLALKPTGGDVTVHSFESVTFSSVGEEAGFIETSNPYIERFQSASKWSQAGNFVSVPTDCPTREYNGWTGDINAFAGTALYHFDSTATMQHFTEIMNKGYAKRGNYNTTMPTTSNGSPSCGWTDAALTVPWEYYMATGDASQLEQCWPQLESYVGGMNGRAQYGVDFRNAYNGALNSAIGWGDHLGIMITSGRFLNCSYHLNNNMLMIKIGEVLGKDVAAYEAMVPVIKGYMANRYIDPDGNVLSRTAAPDETNGGTVQRVSTIVDNAQTAVSWMIDLDIYDEGWQLDAMAANLAKSVYNKDGDKVYPQFAENIIVAGFLGVHKVLPALSKTGQNDAAFALATSTSRNSFMYGVSQPSVPATSIWEEWVSWGPEPGEGYTGGSQNHYAYGASSEWLYEYMLGISKDEQNPGYKHIILQPSVSDRLDYAKGSYKSVYGEIKSGWEVAADGGLAAYSCVVPANTSATLYLPVENVAQVSTAQGVSYNGTATHNGVAVAEFDLASGGYEFAVTPAGEIAVAHADGYAAGPSIGVRADARVRYGDKVEYVFIADNMQSVNLIELTFEVDGNILSGADSKLEGLNGFTLFQDVQWQSLGDDQWRGKAILGILGDGTRSGSMDVGKLALDSVKLGDAKLSLASVTVYGVDVIDGTAKSIEKAHALSPATATAKIFSAYDINGDDKVDLADLSLAFYHYMARLGDANWDDAKVADVNGDGVVNMLDLVEIYANFIA